MVLGASTLPFYSQPETQLMNFARGKTCEADGFFSLIQNLKVERINLGPWFGHSLLGFSQEKSPIACGLGGAPLRVSKTRAFFYFAQAN